MLDSQQKRKINQVLYHKTTLVVISIVVVFMIYSTWMVYQKKLESEKLKNISLKYKNSLEERDVELKLQIERLGTEVGKEAEIRSKFGVAKENENIIVVVDEATTTKSSVVPDRLWQKFLNLFKK